MCAHSYLCDCDWPTFFLGGSDLPIYGPFALAEMLVLVPDSGRARIQVSEDDGFGHSNFIGCTTRHRVRDAVLSAGQNPEDFPCLKECE